MLVSKQLSSMVDIICKLKGIDFLANVENYSYNNGDMFYLTAKESRIAYIPTNKYVKIAEQYSKDICHTTFESSEMYNRIAKDEAFYEYIQEKALGTIIKPSKFFACIASDSLVIEQLTNLWLGIIGTTITHSLTTDFEDAYEYLAKKKNVGVSSCMVGKPIDEFYKSLPVTLAIFYADKVPIARALLWTVSSFEGVPYQYLDRIYSSEFLYLDQVIGYAHSQGWITKKAQIAGPAGHVFPDGSYGSHTFKVPLPSFSDIHYYDYYPYLDTFRYMYMEPNFLTNFELDESPVYTLDEVSGRLEEDSEEDFGECLWCSENIGVANGSTAIYIEDQGWYCCHECVVEDGFVYSTYSGGYVHAENGYVYSDYEDDYLPDHITVWSEYENDYLIRADTVWSEFMEDYLPERGVRDIYIVSISGHIVKDVCPARYSMIPGGTYYKYVYCSDVAYDGIFYKELLIPVNSDYFNLIEVSATTQKDIHESSPNKNASDDDGTTTTPEVTVLATRTCYSDSPLPIS